MQIPKSFTLYGQNIKVQYRKLLFYNKEKMDGLCIPSQNLILLQASTKKYPKSKEQIEQTFLHELTHILLLLSGNEKLYLNEKFVEGFSQLLHQYFITAKY